jgi:hypothetical protein
LAAEGLSVAEKYEYESSLPVNMREPVGCGDVNRLFDEEYILLVIWQPGYCSGITPENVTTALHGMGDTTLM